MVIQSEQLLESLLDLERARLREHEIRVETETLLEGLRRITIAQERGDLFLALVETLRNIIDFDDAFILQAESNNKMTVLATTLDILNDSVWIPDSVFRKTLIGRPIASFDIALVPEWQQQPEALKKTIASALHIGLRGGGRDAILIITHHSQKHFGPTHVKKAKRFSPLAAQALLTLELQQAIIQRDRFFQLSLDVMAIFESGGAIKQYNSVWKSLLGYDLEDLSNKDIYEFIHKDDVETFRTVAYYLNKDGGKELLEFRMSKPNGDILWFSCSLASYHDGNLLYFVARDITDRVIFEQQLAHSAGHDALTGLKNRAEFIESLQLAFRRPRPVKVHGFALLFLDLDKFKAVNDNLGHDIGDELLKFFANTLLEEVREWDTVARLGGDEFTILLENVESHSQVKKVAERIREKCAEPISLKGHNVHVSTSIGIAISSGSYKDEEEMLRAADQAMYQAKSAKNLTYVIDLSSKSDSQS